MDYPRRIGKLREAMVAAEVPAMVISGRENVMYMSGFRGSAGVLLFTEKEQFLFSDFRYITQAAQQAPDYVFKQLGGSIQSAAKDAKEMGIELLGFESHHVTVQQMDAIREAVPEMQWKAQTSVVESIREFKEQAEIDEMKKASVIADQTYEHMCSLLKPGVTEREVAIAGAEFMVRAGAKAPSFDIIVGGGPNAALPHNESGDRPIQDGDIIVLDLGAKIPSGYCSDLTRTVAVGHAEEWQKEIYAVCYAAQLKSLEALKPGVTYGDVDGAARKHITDAGYGDYFGHGVGHGVGFYVHEVPWAGNGSTTIAAVGQTMTIEPGIYLPDRGGVRIEDLTVVTEDGHELLSHAPKPAELLIL